MIESLPDADSIIVIWFKLLCLAGKQNNHGVFMMNGKIAYTDAMMATIFRRKESTVKLALSTFERFGMIEIINGAITIPNWGKHQNFEQIENRLEYQRNYQKEYRKKQKELSESPIEAIGGKKTLRKCLRKQNVNTPDKIREEKIRLDKIREEGEEPPTPLPAKKEKPIKHKYGEYEKVMLDDNQLEKLKTEFPGDWQERIQRLDDYVASTGKVYKDHLATIRNWAKRDAEKKTAGSKGPRWGDADYYKCDPEDSL